MADNDEMEDDDLVDDSDFDELEDREGGVFRWMSVVVVLLAVSGFFGLAWYAYKNGGDAIDENETELVMADAAPVKEAPVNPGGMVIPNQGKTVYENLVGGKAESGKVAEHILASPETPVARNDETEAWMSDQVKEKLKANGPEGLPKDAKPEPIEDKTGAPEETKLDIKEDGKKEPAKAVEEAAKPAEQFKPGHKAEPAPVKEAKPEEKKPEVKAEEKKAEEKPVEKPVAKPEAKPEPKPEPEPKVEAKPEEKKPEVKAEPKAEPKVETKPEPKHETKAAAKKPDPESDEDTSDETTEAPKKPEAKPAAVAGATPPAGVRAQLGAYKSQAEADGQWKKISRKFAGEIGGKNHYVIRADLGVRGVYYRLQLAPFSSSKEVEKFCLSLVGDGQDCFLARGK